MSNMTVVGAERALRRLSSRRGAVAGAALALSLAVLAPGGVRAQTVQPTACAAGVERVPTLGITSFSCADCRFRTFDGVTYHEFSREPEITGIALNGPADGVLEEGDLIVSIDGLLITSGSGAARFTRITPNERVRLRVRRNGSPRDVELRASSYCRGQEPRSRRPHVIQDEPLPHVMPEGWLGIGLECSWCGLKSGAGRSLWRFEQPPRVHGVDPGGPAARAGLKTGDILLEIDGISLVTQDGGDAFSTLRPGQKARFLVERAGERRSITLSVGSRRPPDN